MTVQCCSVTVFENNFCVKAIQAARKLPLLQLYTVLSLESINIQLASCLCCPEDGAEITLLQNGAVAGVQSGTLVVYYDLSILRGSSLLSRSILRARSILRGFFNS